MSKLIFVAGRSTKNHNFVNCESWRVKHIFVVEVSTKIKLFLEV
jgi:hypothetical protein